MNKLTILTKSLTKLVGQHSPAILTGVGAAGVLVTTVLAVKATPKAQERIIAAQLNRVDDYGNGPEWTKFDSLKAGWKPYIPAATAGIGTVVCIFGAQAINMRRQAALMGLVTLGEVALQEYKDEVLETLGTKSANEVHKKIAEKRVAENPEPTGTEQLILSAGEELCYEVLTGRWFKSDKQTLRGIENDMREELLGNQYVSLNSLYEGLGLDTTRIGDEVGWRSGDKIEFVFSAILNPNGKPVLTVDFRQTPHSDYMTWR